MLVVDLQVVFMGNVSRVSVQLCLLAAVVSVDLAMLVMGGMEGMGV